jgi:heptosyltransferase-3
VRRLLIRPGGIGDCILCFPAMQHLACGYLEVWIRSEVVPLVQFADQVISLSSTGITMAGIGDIGIPEALERKLRSFDSIISWYGAKNTDFRTAMARAGISVVFHRALPPEDSRLHAIDYFAGQTGAPAGLSPRISIPTAELRDTVMIHPFSGSARKNWMLENYRELAGRLPLTVEWVAGPEERLAEAMRFHDLGALARRLAGVRLYIGNDSGITHLAAAVGVKTLAIFSTSDPAKWAPRGEKVAVLQSPSVAEALDAANRLLASP